MFDSFHTKHDRLPATRPSPTTHSKPRRTRARNRVLRVTDRVWRCYGPYGKSLGLDEPSLSLSALVELTELTVVPIALPVSCLAAAQANGDVMAGVVESSGVAGASRVCEAGDWLASGCGTTGAMSDARSSPRGASRWSSRLWNAAPGGAPRAQRGGEKERAKLPLGCDNPSC